MTQNDDLARGTGNFNIPRASPTKQGDETMLDRNYRGRGSQGGQGQGKGGGRGQGGGNKPGSGPGGNCVCPKCGHKEQHIVGQRCIDRACPKCGTKMIRE
jgi:hypothetical protein